MNLIEELAKTLMNKDYDRGECWCAWEEQDHDNSQSKEGYQENVKLILPIFAEWIKGIEIDNTVISNYGYFRDIILSELEKMK